MKLVSLLPVLTLSLIAQDPKPATPKAAPKVAAAPSAPQAPKPEAKKVDKVVAVVGNSIIMMSHVDEAFAAMPAQQQQQYKMSPSGMQMFTQQYVDSRLLSAKAKKDGLHATSGFKKKLAQAEQQLLATELINRDGKALQAKTEVKDEELKAYFEKHKDQFKQPDKYTARHILVAIKPGSDKDKGVTDEEAKAKIAKIQAELKAGRPFEELVKEYSDDPGSKNTGGKYEDFDANRMVPEFAKAVKTQELNKVGEPVKTSYGYHLVEVLNKKLAEVPSFEASKEQVKAAMLPERRENVWKGYLDGLRKEIPCVMGEAAEALAVQLAKKAPATQKAMGASK